VVRLWLLLPVLFGFGCVGFGWWGLNTVAGREHFDEMAGIVPFCVGAVGVLLILASAALALLLWWRARARATENAT
jgi:hypothetical protein